ncbi:hypothetical protein GCWU000341_02508 [Oribacterium sp. oral taxon 078 str. F0262]|nr:hypothetical protein GCWU000341_02508 [Oribacterium sp. oral taxon 078 str. F0262]
MRKACADMRMRCCFRPAFIRILLKISHVLLLAAGESSTFSV